MTIPTKKRNFLTSSRSNLRSLTGVPQWVAEEEGVGVECHTQLGGNTACVHENDRSTQKLAPWNADPQPMNVHTAAASMPHRNHAPTVKATSLKATSAEESA